MYVNEFVASVGSSVWSLVILFAATAAFAIGNVHVPGAGDGGGEGGGDGQGDAGAGDGGGDGGEGQQDGAGDGDHVDARGRDGDAGQDDDDDDDADLPDDVRNDPKRLRTRTRRYQRQVRAMRPIAEMFRDQNGKFLSPAEVSRRLSLAQDMEELEPLLGANPDLVNRILELKRGGRPAAAAEDVEDEFQDPFADESKIPWDTSTESGKAFVALFRELKKAQHDLKVENRRLQRQVGEVGTHQQNFTLAQHESFWKKNTLAALKDVPAEAHQAVVSALQSRFELAKHQKTLGRVNVKQLIDQIVTPFRTAGNGRRRVDAGTRQRTAEGNRNTPRPQDQGHRRPAAADERNKTNVGTIKEARQSFFSRIGRTQQQAGR